ncbi:bifunctional diaminohydroxyphosphoribosylaminopyrimidine deaminase/5-amino-6-(5-phosphoribosylamino)uracil reductase RibD [Frigidibacter sp. MR17.14]|uniref:bifunctional diaminohydroxyphosphoribosylaminopyrimidine deaminase/5-amino-6-(5-phosphoribosylamino)uracil reductase RibD n=1 Tax=Frigidibacter sp. MR17.14 TaxID=3126509 RepID=UPI003012BF59
MTPEIDRRFMALALSLGRRGLGRTWPNPAVGCVLVRDGRIVGRGWTQPGGRPHAEREALAQAGAAARGATAYVSLEPCAHHGRTSPCAEALVAAGVARVVSALEDPDPRVAGRGHQILRDAGIEVLAGLMAPEAEAAQIGFLTRIRQGRPMLTLKLATSFDGRIATASGESRWITGPEARHLTHALRARHDAILVGAGTVRADDPMLNVRGLGPVAQPVRIVASAGLDLPLGRLAASAREIPVWLVHGAEAPTERRAAWDATGARRIELPGAFDAAGMMAALGAEGLTRVFCEGGGQLAASLLTAGVVDEVVGFTAGLTLGAEGRASIGALAEAPLGAFPRFRLAETRPVGADIYHRWTRA